jgi:phospho-N-acetylmuramoyl-pentapeptide-transferase
MLYYLITWLEELYQPPGFQIVQFSTVRASLAAITALFIALFGGRAIINWLSRKQLGEQIREGDNAGAVSHAHKAGTPTMGGVIILFAMLGGTLLWARVIEVWVWLVVLATVWMGVIGFVDDYIKTVKKNKEGVPPIIKIVGQVSIGLIVGGVLYFYPAFQSFHTLTSLPFVTDGRLDYYFFRDLVNGIDLGWVVYLPIAVFVMTAVSNAVNLTDGLDGLTTGVTAFVSLGLVALGYISGNVEVADYLNEMYLPGSSETVIFAASMAAACFGFLWFNGYPATVFMGDTGSLALGAAVATLTLMLRKELLLPVLGAIYFLEALSVVIQTSYFKFTKRTTGVGKRVFKMAPLHHHFEALGTHEAKIVTRFWIITAVTVIAAIVSLRVR